MTIDTINDVLGCGDSIINIMDIDDDFELEIKNIRKINQDFGNKNTPKYISKNNKCKKHATNHMSMDIDDEISDDATNNPISTNTYKANKQPSSNVCNGTSVTIHIDDISDQEILVDVVSLDQSHDNHMHKSQNKTIPNRRKITNLVSRQLCEHCCKQIYTHNSVIACPTCPLIVHSQCVAAANFIIGEGPDGSSKWYCSECYNTQGLKRYNPFFECIEMDPMHHNDGETESNDMECILEISNILQNCTPYSIQEFNVTPKCNFENQFSTYFLNVDGNATNFDHFVAELQLYKINFLL